MGVTTGDPAPTNSVTVLSVAFGTQTFPEPSTATRREIFRPAWYPVEGEMAMPEELNSLMELSGKGD